MTTEALPPGTVLGPFELAGVLGAGSFGTVYAAYVLPGRARVALKVLHPHLLHHKQAYARFIREAQITARIKHPHVVDIVSIGQEGPYVYFCMEYLDGEPLSAMIRRAGALSLAEIAKIMVPVLSGVAAIHEVGCVHRDLKPGNIFLWKPAPGLVHPKILDFGVVKPLDSSAHDALTVPQGTPEKPLDPLTHSQMALGTPHYMAPEQILDSQSAGPSCDQWALGVILYECVTGTRPFLGGSVYDVFDKVLKKPFIPPSKVKSSIPASFEALILRMLEREPAKRFPSVRAVGAALLEFADAATRKRYGREFGLQIIHDTITDDDEVAHEHAALSILAPDQLHEPLSTLDAIGSLRPRVNHDAKFVPADLDAERRTSKFAALAWSVTMMLFACVLGAWKPWATDAPHQKPPVARTNTPSPPRVTPQPIVAPQPVVATATPDAGAASTTTFQTLRTTVEPSPPSVQAPTQTAVARADTDAQVVAPASNTPPPAQQARTVAGTTAPPVRTEPPRRPPVVRPGPGRSGATQTTRPQGRPPNVVRPSPRTGLFDNI